MTELSAIQQIGFPILSLLILLPLIAVAALQFAPTADLQRKIALGGAGASLALSLILVIAFQRGTADIQFVERLVWMPSIGAGMRLGVDGISLLFLPLTALVIGVALFASPAKEQSGRHFWTHMLLLEAAAFGVFTSMDLLFFLLCWELVLIPSYFLIRLWGGSGRQSAAMKYVLYMLVGSAPLLLAIAALGANYEAAVAAGEALPGGNFSFVNLLDVPVSPDMQGVIFLLMFISFAVKAPLPPFHTWLPAAIMQSPAGMAMFLVGLKLGTFGMLRFLLPLFPEVAIEWGTVLSWVGVAAMVYGAMVALAQQNLRRLLAFAGVSHVGLVVAGLFSLSPAGIQGALFSMLNIALTSTALMYLASALHRRTGSTDIAGLGGVARHAPKLSTFFLIFLFAAIGMPGTTGFIAEFPLLYGTFTESRLIGAVALSGVVLSAGYMLWFYERAFFGPVTATPVRHIRDLGTRESAAMGVVLAIVLIVGVAPNSLISLTKGSTDALARHIALSGSDLAKLSGN